MNPQQLIALKADIAADPVMSTLPNTPDDNFTIAAMYNQAASPDFWVWKTEVSAEEIMSNGFVWTTVDGLTVGKARIWEWMTRYGTINPSKPNVRQGIQDCFVGQAAMINAILPHLRRKATRAEKLFATGTGSANQPATMGFEGTVTYLDVTNARELP